MARDDNLLDSLAGEAVGTLVPFGGESLGKRAMGAVRREWTRNTSQALRAAEAAAGFSREDLGEWLECDPRAVPLYMKVLWAAGTNGHDETLRAMGAVFGMAAQASVDQDDDDLTRAELALSAMSNLGPLHFRILAALRDSVVVVQSGGGKNYGQFTADFVGPAAGVSVDVAMHCLLNLANSGLTEFIAVLENSAFPVTSLGRAVLKAAEEVA